jgi:hypothetical protein
VGQYRRDTDIVKFAILDACPECCGDYKIYDGVTVGVRTARRWSEIAERGAARFAALDVEELMRDDRGKLVHLPSNLRHKSQHQGQRKKEAKKWGPQPFEEGA